MRLSAILGQPAAVRLLSRLVAHDRVPHALLFDGMSGCGRRTLSMAVAQALLCPTQHGGEACDTCPSCRLIREGNHPDLVSLPHESEAGELSVELVRTTIVENAQQSPLLGSRRVFLLPSIERLNNSASNALLKVLEEPPAGAYFLMSTAQTNGLLRTIRSRSQLIRLQPLSSAHIERILTQGGIAPGEARRRAATASGSHRDLWDDTLEIPLEPLLALCREGFTTEAVHAIYSALPHKVSDDLGRTLLQEQRRVLGRWLLALAQALRTDLSGSRGPRAADAIERLTQLHHDLKINMNPRLVIEGIALGART